MPVQTTNRLALPWPDGNDPVSNGDNVIRALAEKADNLVPFSQGTLASRPVSTNANPGIAGRRYYANDVGLEYLDLGTAWIISSAPAVVTSLPTSPADGQEVYFIASASAGIMWRLRYRAGSASAYKWEFVGGSPLLAATAATSTIGTGFASLNCQVTTPLAGDYLLTASVQAFMRASTHTAYLRLDRSGTFLEDVAGSAVVNGYAILTRAARAWTAAPANATWGLSGRADVDSTDFIAPALNVTPVRVG